MKLIYNPDDKGWYWQRYSDWKTSQLFHSIEEAKQAKQINILRWDGGDNEDNKTKARQWLEAVASLIAYYKGENDLYGPEIDYCPLCSIANCSDCLWMIYEGGFCNADASIGQYIEYSICISDLRLARHEPWTTDSLKRLRRWKGKLNEIIEEKK